MSVRIDLGSMRESCHKPIDFTNLFCFKANQERGSMQLDSSMYALILDGVRDDLARLDFPGRFKPP